MKKFITLIPILMLEGCATNGLKLNAPLENNTFGEKEDSQSSVSNEQKRIDIRLPKNKRIKEEIFDSYRVAINLLNSKNKKDRALGKKILEKLGDLGFSPAQLKLGIINVKESYEEQGIKGETEYLRILEDKFKKSFDPQKEISVKPDKLEYKIKEIKTLHEGYGESYFKTNKRKIIVPKIVEKKIILGPDGVFKELEIEKKSKKLKEKFIKSQMNAELKLWKEHSEKGTDKEKMELIKYTFDNGSEREIKMAKDILMGLVKKGYKPAIFEYSLGLISGRIFKQNILKGVSQIEKLAAQGFEEAKIFLESSGQPI